MPTVVADGVVKRYGETAALSGVSLSVDAGEVFACIGPNGAGKTTLVRALTGTTDPDDGRVELFGGAPAESRRERVGLLPQAYAPPDRLTARELLSYYAGLYDDARPVDAVLADVGLADAAGTRYGDLSGGQRRRACVGAALVNDPAALFLDEPTTGVDPAGRRDLWRLVEDLAEDGAAVFLTTHSMAEAERLADTVGLLAGGELLAEGSPADLVAAHGGEVRLSVETEADPDALADADRPVEAGPEGLVFPGLSPRDIGDAVAALEAAGVEYGALTWREPDLEDVYLSLTGEPYAVDGEGDGRRRGRPAAGGGRR